MTDIARTPDDDPMLYLDLFLDVTFASAPANEIIECWVVRSVPAPPPPRTT